MDHFDDLLSVFPDARFVFTHRKVAVCEERKRKKERKKERKKQRKKERKKIPIEVGEMLFFFLNLNFIFLFFILGSYSLIPLNGCSWVGCV